MNIFRQPDPACGDSSLTTTQPHSPTTPFFKEALKHGNVVLRHLCFMADMVEGRDGKNELAGTEETGKIDVGKLSDDDLQNIAMSAQPHIRKMPRLSNAAASLLLQQMGISATISTRNDVALQT